MISNSRKVDRDLFNNSAEDFIPIACHYDSNTLLTKNGELLQIIQINGINSENISDQLFDLRKIVRNAIKTNTKNKNFAFWIHTVRRKTNLDDPTPYKKLLPANIHNLWQQKNYWDDKFVNTLYISIVYDSAALKIKNFGTFLTSLSFKKVTDFQNKYLESSIGILTNTVNSILSDLQEFGAVKLGIRFEGEESYSDLMFLYRRIIHLSEEYCLVPIANLANALASNQYAVGSDKIEVISAEHYKKFASIISLKEYQEISTAALDNFLQLPIELITTEIFYFIDKKEVTKNYEKQAYILEISKDEQLAEITGLSSIMNRDDSSSNEFCKQQISIAIIAPDLVKLEQSVAKASLELSKIGIVHVREDINLEQIFWSQLPSNFSFIRRMTPTIIDNVAALASLHNFPTGEQKNIWGRAVTLLRTEKGTPYFMNFHAKNSTGGNTCIFGTPHTGKTTLTNFLISEATKYNPSILYISNNDNSKIFIEAIEGQWSTPEKNVINPFLLDDTIESRNFITEFLKIICNNNYSPLTEGEIQFLEQITDKIFLLDMKNRNFTEILKSVDFTTESGELIKLKLVDYQESGLYDGVFNNNFSISEGKTIGLNLYHFSEKSFSERFYPTDRKLLETFAINLTKHNSLRASLIYALNYHFNLIGKNPKILALDNLDSLYKPENFVKMSEMILDHLAKNNGVLISNFNFQYLESQKAGILKSWLNLMDTQIILPSETKPGTLKTILELKEPDINKLSKLSVTSRMFLIKQNNQSIVLELSIGGLVGITKILSCSEQELEIYRRIIEQHPGHPDDWINPLYMELN
ncbi:MAG: VirB4 family type IV secretion/conjugal transfer ATPase [Rickettsia endosymbiont of Bryobia graminum]|nr:VirB4 family type IV secretion/conjugal transfer ATPase [Rickettsia endosymbiont of Bryobia graminum]